MTEAVENSTSPNKAVLVKGSKGLGMRELIYYFLAFLDCRKKNYSKTGSLSPINLALDTT
jgi:hypothetical protein